VSPSPSAVVLVAMEVRTGQCSKSLRRKEMSMTGSLENVGSLERDSQRSETHSGRIRERMKAPALSCSRGGAAHSVFLRCGTRMSAFQRSRLVNASGAFYQRTPGRIWLGSPLVERIKKLLHCCTCC